MHNLKKPCALFAPSVKEMIKAIKNAVCEMYEISEEELLKDGSFEVAGLRYYCFWLLFKNAGLKYHSIGAAFGRHRDTVRYGVDQIESQRDVYRDVSNALKHIAEAANKYPKKFEWHLQ